jgi:hypothetical protein
MKILHANTLFEPIWEKTCPDSNEFITEEFLPQSFIITFSRCRQTKYINCQIKNEKLDGLICRVEKCFAAVSIFGK